MHRVLSRMDLSMAAGRVVAEAVFDEWQAASCIVSDDFWSDVTTIWEELDQI